MLRQTPAGSMPLAGSQDRSRQPSPSQGPGRQPSPSHTAGRQPSLSQPPGRQPSPGGQRPPVPPGPAAGPPGGTPPPAAAPGATAAPSPRQSASPQAERSPAAPSAAATPAPQPASAGTPVKVGSRDPPLLCLAQHLMMSDRCTLPSLSVAALLQRPGLCFLDFVSVPCCGLLCCSSYFRLLALQCALVAAAGRDAGQGGGRA